uniref:AMP-dependent synthetase/ligase domain-containing protein n=1 Tax=Branchiostoma floridae TaxID=7739 RepID=C3ZI93_BRAFL|eukprot:XP_002591607.1 hypothetical protein BRAFLDRAFT_80703 [Branchiostoma floridae]
MSYNQGPTDIPLVEQTFGQLLDDTAARWPDTEAYVFKKTGARASRLAAGLKAIGTERGDVVAWLVGHRPEWIYLYFAVAKLGAIAAGVKVLIMGDVTGVDETDDTVPYLCSLFPEVKTAKPGKLQIERIGAYTMDEVQTMGSDEKIIAEVRALQDQLSCHDTFWLRFTSGSTGQPKCVEHSTYSFYNYLRLATKRFRTTAEDFHDMLHDPRLAEYDLSSVRAVTIGGNVTSKSLIDRAADVLPNVRVVVGYGMTETLGVAGIPADMTGEGKGATVGKLSPHVEAQKAQNESIQYFSLFSTFSRKIDVGTLDEDGVLRLYGRVSMVPIELPGYFIFLDEFPVTTTLQKVSDSLFFMPSCSYWCPIVSK